MCWWIENYKEETSNLLGGGGQGGFCLNPRNRIPAKGRLRISPGGDSRDEEFG